MFERIRFLLNVAAALAVVVVASMASAIAQSRPLSFIRDAEIEATIRAFATPLFTAAGLDARSISVHLVNDRTLNAFVANGLNMYLNTGLLMRTEHAGQVIGVIAHESGHIQGGHLVQIREQLRQATIPYFLEMLATVGAAAAGARSGNPNDWGGYSGGGQGPTVTERFLLQYSRGMESQADQAGIQLLERTRQSSRGLMEFLDVIADQELLLVGRQSPYVRTHPITRERIESVRNHVEHSRFSNTPMRDGFAEAHARMRAKLYGFLDPVRALQIYPESDRSVPARYARAIAHFKRLDFNRAHAVMDALIAERPKDAYLLEAKGQFYLEQGKPEDARALYARAAVAAPEEPLIIQSLGWAELQSGAVKKAITTLEGARRLQPEDADTWRLLAQAYSRDGQLGLADYAQAENFSLRGRSMEAAHFAERALRQLPPNSTTAIKAQDIKDLNQRRPLR